MAEDEAMDLIKRKLASLSPVKVVVEKELMEYLHIITDGYCGALSWLTDELYKGFRDELCRNSHISYEDGRRKIFADPRKLAEDIAESQFGRALYTDRDVILNNVPEMIVRDGYTTSQHCEQIGSKYNFNLYMQLQNSGKTWIPIQ